MKRNKSIFLVLIYLIIGGLIFFKFQFLPKTNNSEPITQTDFQPTLPDSTESLKTSSLAEPVANFKARVTKKPFGIYSTPQNSPIQPERFTGYHTGADAEYEDAKTAVPVFAVNDGKITFSQYASGYGGVFILETEMNEKKHSVLYGHIRPASLPRVGTTFSKGQQIALLGTGYSNETNGERRHLHFAILTDTRLDIKGYVSKKADLSGWINPLSLY